MVGLDLHAEGECEEGRSEDCLRQPALPSGFLDNARNDRDVFLRALPVILSVSEGSHRRPVCEYHTGQHPWEISDSLHLGVVADLDDLHVV